MSGLQFRAQQTLHPPGWSRLNREVVQLRAEGAEQLTADAELQLRATVHRTWWMLVRTRLLRQVTSEHVDRANELLAAARARYETGAVGQHAVLRLQVLRDTLLDDLTDFVRTDRELTSALVQALGSSDRSFPTPTEATAVNAPQPQDWAQYARDHRPLLVQLTADRHAAERGAALARVDTLPDVSVWAGYRIRTVQTQTDPGTNLVSLGLTVPIPSGSARRLGGEHRALLEDAHAVQAREEAAIDQIVAEAETALARWERATNKVKTYDEVLLPNAQLTLTTTQSDFMVGRADFASLFEAEVTTLNLERARIAAVVETHLQAATLSATVGIPEIGDTP